MNTTIIATPTANYPENPEDEVLARLLDDYLTSLEAGDPLELDELIAEYPHLGDDIRMFAACVDRLHLATVRGPRHDNKKPVVTTAKLGEFELGDEIGRGGMGIVYAARQSSLDRQVALKVLPLAATWDDKQVARFRNEAQAAAQLQHPNIVPVYAVGEEQGVHYYAMQLIAGESLDKLIFDLKGADEPSNLTDEADTRPARDAAYASPAGDDAGNCPASSRLRGLYCSDRTAYCRAIAELGIAVAEALHDAHECGVVHRDVKPSNLILEQAGKVWVADFGLARVRDCPGVTVTGDVVGTLRYISPEQATGQHTLVDQRTDVYALGATLYELLTLQYAFSSDDRRQVLHDVQHRQPRPLRAVDNQIHRDLETIVLTSMAKTPAERYDTAAAQAVDLRRFLEGQPIRARRPTFADRATKWLARRRLLACSAMLVLLAVASVSTTGAALLAREKAQKAAALQQAEKNYQHAQEVIDRFDVHLSRSLAEIPGGEHLLREILQQTLTDYEKLTAHAAQNSSLRPETAQTALRAAKLASRLGDANSATELYASALRGFEELAATEPEADRFLRYQATCLNDLGLLAATKGDTELAQREFHRALQLQTELVGNHKDNADATHSLAEMLVNLALLQRQRGAVDKARETIGRGIELLSELADVAPQDFRHSHALAIALNNRSFVERQSDWQAAATSSQAAVHILEKLGERFARTPPPSGFALEPKIKSDLALCYNNLGSIRGHLGQHVVACELYRKAIAIQEKLARQAPGLVRHRSELAVSWNNLGQSHAQCDETAQAVDAFERARSIFSELVEDYPETIGYLSSLAGVHNNLAMALERAGEVTSSLAFYELAIGQQKLAIQQASHVDRYREHLSKHYANFTRALRKAGRTLEATNVARQLDRFRTDELQQEYESVATTPDVDQARRPGAIANR